MGEFVENFRDSLVMRSVLPDLADETWELQADRLVLQELAIVVNGYFTDLMERWTTIPTVPKRRDPSLKR